MFHKDYGFLLTFDKENEAKEYKEAMIKESKRLKDRYENLAVNNPNKIKKFIKTSLEKFGVEVGMMDSDEWYLDVVQVVLNNPYNTIGSVIK